MTAAPAKRAVSSRSIDKARDPSADRPRSYRRGVAPASDASAGGQDGVVNSHRLTLRIATVTNVCLTGGSCPHSSTA
jgi:hypothetical protein